MATEEAGIVPKVILIPNSRSHPFVQRECVVTEPLKVGRSVDKRRISPNNLIFDCRVLSRNHALIWYDQGKFYIKDTKSSNGTFVNDSRLSHSGDESLALELKSRDVIQFGVNVNVEKRVTHGCIVATIKLLINDKELPGPDPDTQQVMQIVQSALLKEQELETKLASMQEVIMSAHSLTKENMMAIVKEDELLSRLEMLENQVQISSQNISEDELRQKLSHLIEEKHKEERTTKEAVRSLLQEKIDFQSKLSQLQRDYDKAEEECQKFRSLYDSAKQQHTQETAKLNEEVKTTEKKLTEMESKSKEEHDKLQASLEQCKEEADFKDKQLTAMKTRLQQAQDEVTQLKAELDTLSLANNTVSQDKTQSGNSDIENQTPKITGANSETSHETHTQTVSSDDVDQVVEGASVTSPIAMVATSMEDTVTTAKIQELESQIASLKEKLFQSEQSTQLLHGGGDGRDVQAGPVSLEEYTELAEYKVKYTELSHTATSYKEQLHRKETEVTQLQAASDLLQQQLMNMETQYHEKMEEQRHKNEELREKLSAAVSQSSPVMVTNSSSTVPSSSDNDPRIKILAVITLSSITVAIISVLIAYFF